MIARKNKIPKVKQRIVYKRSYRRFSQEAFLRDIGNIKWSEIYEVEEPNDALELFIRKFQPVIDNHAPIKKLIIKDCRASWIDSELKDNMAQRDEAMRIAKKIW